MQKNFKEYIEESLNSPLEFYMTDDTDMPREIYAALNLDGTDYGFSLVLSKTEKVYLLHTYRILNGKKRYWSFKTKVDIRPVLSTSLKFVEACMPFIQSKMDGIIIGMPGGKDAAKYQRLLTLALKKTYINKFKVVPVKKLSDKVVPKLFIIKKSVDPVKLFKSQIMSKYFEIVPNASNLDEVLTDEVVDDIAKPKKKMKPNASTTPSTKYSFYGLETDTDHSDEKVQAVFDMPSSADFVDHTKNTDENLDVELPVFDTSNVGMFEAMVALTVNMPSMSAKIREKGFEESEFNKDNFKWVLGKLDNPAMKDILSVVGLFDKVSGKYAEPEKFIPLLKKYASEYKKTIASSGDYDPASIDVLYKMGEYNEKLKQNSNPSLSSNIQIKKEATAVKISDLKSGVPGNLAPEFGDDGAFDVSSPISEIKESVTWLTKTYEKSLDELANNDYGTYSHVYKYTGSSYDYYNDRIRESVQELATSWSATGDVTEKVIANAAKKVIDESPHVVDMYRAFEKVIPSPEPLWTYRAGTIPEELANLIEPGYEYVDPAFLSTSLRRDTSFGNNLRLAIYNPKGTKMLPMLNRSKHSIEKEVILPPMSLLKVIRIDKAEYGRYILTCVNMGSLMDSFLNKAELAEQTQLNMIGRYAMAFSEEKKKEKEYDPDGKYSSNIDDTLSKALIAALKRAKKQK